MRFLSASACAWVMRPAARSALTWSMAAALVASLSFCGLTPRCLATESRKSDPRDPVPVAATAAAAPPTTASVAAAATTNRFDPKFIGGSKHPSRRGPEERAGRNRVGEMPAPPPAGACPDRTANHP